MGGDIAKQSERREKTSEKSRSCRQNEDTDRSSSRSLKREKEQISKRFSRQNEEYGGGGSILFFPLTLSHTRDRNDVSQTNI